ncbi:unnamed protein product [Pocillopora meandrina]|uniref:Ion transport domain-containing protein n=1 Tax=Pocillopora meandrina TaxID=46732 RepID=A0AAU9WMA3_9CNID|nr:unnamed protein product [Pocillopora meandrina]
METPFDQKINVVYLDESRRTPVHRAALDGKHEQVEEKVRVASGLDDQDEQERTPLHDATEHGHRKVCHTLLQHGANSSMKDREHWTPLMSASDLGKEQSCQDILTVNPETDDVNMDGETALHIACRRGNVGVVNLLMDYGASLNVCNKDGVTCFETAAKSGKSEVVFAMIKHKRWMEIMEHKDKNGLTPMKLLIKHFPESAQLVMDYCIDRSETESSDDPNFTVTCNLRFLDPTPTDTTYLRESLFFGPSTMVKHERRELLDHPLTQVLLNKKWSSFGRLVFFFNFMFYFVFVVMITAFLIRFMQNGDKELGDYFIYVYPIAFLLIGVQFTKEVIVILVQRLQYFTTLSNLTEWLLYSTTTSFMVSLFIFDLIFSLSGRDKRDIVYPQFIWVLAAISIFLCYANLVLVLRRLSLVGIYVTMFIEVTKSVLKVLLIFFVLFFGFSMVFYVLFKSEESVFKHLGFALLKVTVMTIGEVDFEGRFMRSQNITNEPTSSQIASFVFLGLFLILMTIVLMNLLVCIKIRNFSVTFNSTSWMHKCKSTSMTSSLKLFSVYFYSLLYKTNRFQVAVRLFSNRSQRTSKCGKNFLTSSLNYARILSASYLRCVGRYTSIDHITIDNVFLYHIKQIDSINFLWNTPQITSIVVETKNWNTGRNRVCHRVKICIIKTLPANKSNLML